MRLDQTPLSGAIKALAGELKKLRDYIVRPDAVVVVYLALVDAIAPRRFGANVVGGRAVLGRRKAFPNSSERSRSTEKFDATADQGFIREAGQRRQAVGAMFKWAVAQDILVGNPADGLASHGLGAPRDRASLRR